MNLLNKIVNADSSEIYEIIKANNDYFNVDLSEKGDYAKLTERAKTELWKNISDGKFERPEEVETAINGEVVRQITLDAMFTEIKAVNKGEDAIEILEKYAEELVIDLEKEYGYALLEDISRFNAITKQKP